MITKEHLKESGWLRILSLKTVLNKGVSKKLIKEFPNIIILSRPEINNTTKLLDNNWIAGFTAAEGSFSITINEKDNRKFPQVRVRFSIGLDSRDRDILIKLKDQLNIGNLHILNNKTSYEIGKLQDIKEKLIPLFDSNQLNNIKDLDFKDWKKVVFLIEKGEHLTKSGLLLIREIKSAMNLRRK